MILELSKTYCSRYGAPSISKVDEAIFRFAYFADCRACDFCADQCCSWGVDVDEPNMARLLAHADALEARTGVPKERWFEAELEEDPDFPGGRVGRTRAEDGACVFLDRKNRGCHIHGYCLEVGLDVYSLKPFMSSLFPLTFGEGLLLVSDEVEEGSLACTGPGQSVYRGSRGVLEHCFGTDFVAELDRLETAAPVRRGG